MGIPGFMDIPSPWGTAVGYTAEALKTQKTSGVLQASARAWSNKMLFKCFISLQGIFILNLENRVCGGNDPTQTVLIVAQRCICYWGISVGAFLVFCRDGVAMDGMGKGDAAVLLTPPHHSMPVHNDLESSVCK